nr:ATP-binding protein [uncultured Desulfobulbus sp.]
MAIFVVLVNLYGFVRKIQFAQTLTRQFVFGVLFSLTALVCMQVRIEVFEGVLVDQRNGIIVLSTLFGGPVSGLLTMCTAAAYRVHLGGGGVIAGVFGMLLSLLAGMLWRGWRRQRDWLFFLLGATFSSFLILPGFLLVGDFATGWALLQRMALPYGIACLVGMLFVGFLIQREEHRLLVEEQLKVSERKYRQLFESMVDISFEFDNEGIIQIISPSVMNILGYAPSEVIGTPVYDYYASSEGREIFLQNFAQRTSVENFQVQMLHKNGAKVWFSVNGRLLIDDQGKRVGLHGLARDISTIKKAEEEREMLEQSLLQSRKMEAIGTLAGGIAHDFNNILGGIIGYAEIMQREVAAQHTDGFRKYLRNILVAAERAQNLIKQILAFSRQAALELKPVSVREVIEDVVVLMRASLPATIAIEMQLNTECCVLADKVQIHQVIMNLCTNAGHAMKEGGGTLSITLDEGVLEEKLAQKNEELAPDPYVRIQVRDTGKGIPQQQLERIFDPFFTTKKKGEGTGLGLSMVHGIISAMQGHITVESRQGQGTLFTIYLPQTSGDAAKEVEEGPLPRGHEQIVFIDDDPFLTNIGGAILEELGYRVVLFNDSQDALQYIMEHREEVDLVVTDMTMPKMTGLDLAGWLRASRVRVPILLCTGYSEGMTEEQLRGVNVQKCIVKPINSQLLASSVRSLLDNVN